MESSTSETGPFALIRALIRELAAESPAQLMDLFASLNWGASGSLQRAVDAAFVALRELEEAGPEQWSVLLDALVAWAEGDDVLETRLKPAIERLSTIVAGLTLVDVGAELDAIVMPLLEKLSAACVDAMMGDPA